VVTGLRDCDHRRSLGQAGRLLPHREDDNGHTRRMIALLVDGLRYGAHTRETR
jgi:hypothetical protein